MKCFHPVLFSRCLRFFRSAIRRYLMGLACLACVASANAAELLNEIAAQVQQYPVIRAEFEQTRQMAALKRPLVTAGRLTFSREHGVLWRIEKPYRMVYVLGEARIVEIGENGTRRVREARDVPGLAQVGRVFRAMLGANSAALREYFDVTAQGVPSKWTIELKPRQAQMAQFLTAMHLSGGGFVDAIRISEASGDSTQIRFFNSQGAAVPNEAELSLFGANDAGGAR